WPMLQELRRRDDVLSATLGWLPNAVVDAQTGTGSSQVAVSGVSGDFFSELGASPVLGRLLSPDEPEGALPAIQDVLASIGVESLPRVATLEYITGRTVLTERLLAMLAAYFGGLAVVLAAIGIHGQMAYTVSLQRKEI